MDFQCTSCQHNHIIWNNWQRVNDCRLEEASSYIRTGGNKSTAKSLITLSAFNIGILVLFLTYETIKLFLCCFLCLGRIPRILHFQCSNHGDDCCYYIKSLDFNCDTKKGKCQCTERRRNTVIMIVLILALATNIPHLFYYTAEDGIGLERTNYGKSNAAKRYNFWVYCVFLVLGAWLSIGCSNIVIIQKVSGHAKRFITSSGMILRYFQIN